METTEMKIFKEQAGIISENECWVCFYGNGYMAIADTYKELLEYLRANWKNDNDLVG